MYRLAQAIAFIALLVITGCSDSVTAPSGTLGADASLLAEDVSLNLLGNGEYALALAGENTEVITEANVAESRAEHAALFQDAIKNGYDGMSIVTSPGEPDIIQYWKFEDAVVWDGVSPLESGVMYDLSIDPVIKTIRDSEMTSGEKLLAGMDRFVELLGRGAANAN